MRLNRKTAILLLIGCLMMALLCGCGEKDPAQTKEPEPTPTQATDVGTAPEPTAEPTPEPTAEPTPEPTEEPEPTPEEPQVVEDPELADPRRDWEPIETKFGRLRYPDQFFEFLETEQTESDNEVKVLFRAVIGEKRIDMFEVIIGGFGGDSVGTITGPDGTVRNVYLRFIEIEDLDGLTEGETDRVYAMQEALNFVLDSLK